MMAKKSIKEILTRKVVSVQPTTPARDVVSIMKEKKISCVLVVDDKKPVGIFTERNLVQLLHQRVDIGDKGIDELMSTPVLSIESSTNIYEAHDFLESHGVRHLVVVEPDGRIAGVVTQTDIMDHLEAEYFLERKDLSRIMTRNVITLKKEQLVQDAVDIMAKILISCILVEDNNIPVGILTERDITRLFSLENKDIGSLKIEEVMSCPVETMPKKASLYEATTLMTGKKIRRLVVVDDNGCIAGLVTQRDILKELEWNYIKSLHEVIQENEEKLIEAERLAATAQIAKELAHEIRNPLHVLTVGLYCLREISPKDNVNTQKTIERMNNAILRVNGFIDKLLQETRR